jgi:hypothetical protein
MIESGERVIEPGCEAAGKTRAHVRRRWTAKQHRRERGHCGNQFPVNTSRHLANLNHAQNLNLE